MSAFDPKRTLLGPFRSPIWIANITPLSLGATMRRWCPGPSSSDRDRAGLRQV